MFSLVALVFLASCFCFVQVLSVPFSFFMFRHSLLSKRSYIISMISLKQPGWPQIVNLMQIFQNWLSCWNSFNSKSKTLEHTGVVFYFPYCWIFKIFFTFFLLPTIIVVSYWQSTNQIWTSVENIKMQKSQKTWLQRIFLLTFCVWFLLLCLTIHSPHPLIIYDGVGTDDGPSKDETFFSITRIDWIVKIAR